MRWPSLWFMHLLPLLWLALFLILPLLIVLKISFAEPLIASPPYSPLIDWRAEQGPELKLNLGNYQFLLEDPLYAQALWSSLKVASFCTLICLLVGYPMAFAIATAPREWRALLVLAVILPFWTSFLLRVYAWMGLLSRQGVLSQVLQWLGLVDAQWTLLKTQAAVQIGLVYMYLPFMVLPIYAALDRMDRRLIEAACDLGASPWRAFWRVTWPLSAPGVAAGVALVFIPVVGEFVIPSLLGGADTLMLGKVLWDEFFGNRSWPTAAAVAMGMLLLIAALSTLRRWLWPHRVTGP